MRRPKWGLLACACALAVAGMIVESACAFRGKAPLWRTTLVSRSSGLIDGQPGEPVREIDLGVIEMTGYASGTGSVITLESLGVWVNNAFAGTELGTFSNPFNTVSEGVAGVPPGSTTVTLHLRGGNYSGGITITQPMFVQVESGPAYLGAP